MKKVLWIAFIFGSTLFILSQQAERPEDPDREILKLIGELQMSVNSLRTDYPKPLDNQKQ